MEGERDKASPRVITILHVRGFLPRMARVCLRVFVCARARTSVRALVWERERGVNVDHASSRARSTLSRRLSPCLGLRRSLVCPYPPSLICGRFLTTPWAANSDVRLSTRSSEGTAPNLDRFTFEQVRREMVRRSLSRLRGLILRKNFLYTLSLLSPLSVSLSSLFLSICVIYYCGN